MFETAKLQGMDNNDMNDIAYERDEESIDADTRAYELRVWPPPYLQAYCLEHFLMECKTHHEQEKERYDKLVVYSREVFLDRRTKERQPNRPTRRQPTRQAKENHLVIDMKSPQTSTAQTGLQRFSTIPKKSLNTPFKPAELEKAFAKSREGAMFRVVSRLRKKLELHKSWEEYRRSLEAKVEAKARELRAITKKEQEIHEKCIFGEPLGVDCRYCGFTDTVQDNDATTPRKLAVPAAMHAIAKASNAKESEVLFRGAQFVVDVCGEKTMVILVGFKGVLDLCAELLVEEEALPSSPTSLSIRLGSIQLQPRGADIVGKKRRLEQHRPVAGRKRQKYSGV